MAATHIAERFQARRSTYSDGKATHERQWLVTCDDIADGTAVAIRAVPGPGTSHPNDFTAIVTALNAQPHGEDALRFLVTATYTTLTWTARPASIFDADPEISYGAVDATEGYFKDHSDTPKFVVNKAGDPFDSDTERETGEITFTITVNEPNYSPVVMSDIKHTTNKEAVTIDGTTYAPGTLKVGLPTAVKMVNKQEGPGGVITETKYAKVTYPVKARKDGWNDKLLNVGFNELIKDPAQPTVPGKLRPIIDSCNLPLKKPVPLDANGRKKVSQTSAPPDPDELEFQPYRAIAWGELKPFKPETWGLVPATV